MTNTRPLDYYFTPVSPWAFLGHDRFVQLLKDTGRTANVLPVDFGVIFPASGGLPLPKRAPQRQAYRLLELRRFAEHLGVALNPQPAFFPLDGAPASRLIVAAQRLEGSMAALELAGRIGRAIWVEQRNAADEGTLRALVAEAGLPDSVWDDSLAPEMTVAYAANTQQAIEAGVFGAPSYVIDGEIFWGQDRLDFVERRLKSA
jgi:2-hydroxychromene-2-carboxylate isomerase